MAVIVDKGPLPDYERPPVVETVLGVQFEEIPHFGNAQLGAFWKTLDPAEWVSVTDAPPLEPQFEQFGEGMGPQPLLAFRWTQDLRTRLQIKNEPGDRMIQIQNSRFHFNWLGKTAGYYPRYPAVRDGFEAVLKQFVTFVGKEKLRTFRPNQWELTYINNIPKGTVWNAPSDWGFFRPLRGVPTLPNLIEGETFTGQWHCAIPHQRGRLHMQWQHGLPPAASHDRQETIWLTFTARGPLGTADDPVKAVLEGLELGHVTIVQSFKALMSEEANAFWGLKT